MSSSASFSVPATSSRLSASAMLAEDAGRLKYVSGGREEALRRLGIKTVEDLLLHIPRRYLDFSRVRSIGEAQVGETCTIVGTIDRVSKKPMRNPRKSLVEVFVVDETGVLQAAFFNQPWLAKQLERGAQIAVRGTVEFAYGFKQMSAPSFELLEAGQAGGAILPVHPACEGISVAWMRRIISAALESLGRVADPLPAQLRARHGLMDISCAYRAIHFPRSMSEVAPARRRLAYDELLYLQLAMRIRDDEHLVAVEPVAHTAGGHVEALRAALPYELTPEQEQAATQVLADMADPERPMNRLLMGDVGTGKTAVACIALACAADTGTQACMMAPTGVLARQYATNAGPLLDAAGVSWALLTAATGAAERDSITRALAQGRITVLFGTHAVLGQDVAFKRLSLVVIDEQHRFGVNQRNALRDKGPGADLLVMTATPIPRTMALSVYGDLTTSIIRTRPRPGAGTATRVLESGSRDLAYEEVRAATSAGQQAYVICPLVSEGDETDAPGDDVPGIERDDDGAEKHPTRLHAVDAEAADLRRVFPELRVGELHGRMKPREKDRAIEAFRAHETDILVSTTVVEVGVDVPNATVMLIENAERYGLATLHQLRGRVGRGDLPGLCIALTEVKAQRGKRQPALERLQAFAKTEDGFALAEMDLRLRHEGEILGLRQSGGVTLRFVDLDADVDIIEGAREDADELLRYAPTLSSTATMPLRHEVVKRYGEAFREVSGG